MLVLTLARKPPDDAVARTVTQYGTGAMNIGASRIGYTFDADKWKPATSVKPIYKGYMEGSGQAFGAEHHKPTVLNAEPDVRGRWPANLVLSGEGGRALDDQSGVLTSGVMKAGTLRKSLPATRAVFANWGFDQVDSDFGGDSGGASRFFKSFP